MTANGLLQVALCFIVLMTVAIPLGIYMAKVYSGEPVFLRMSYFTQMARLAVQNFTSASLGMPAGS